MAFAKGKGFCPPSPQITGEVAQRTAAVPIAPTAEAHYVGTVTVMVVISDKGYVCDVHLLRGIDKLTDKAAVASLRKWQFAPARKDGRAVPAVVSAEVDLWRSAKDELVESSRDLSPLNTQGLPEQKN